MTVPRRIPVRGATVLLMALGGFLGLGLVAAPAASAHPLGNFTVNRYSGLLLAPGSVELAYVVDMAEIPTFQQMPSIDTDGDGSASPAEREAWAVHEAPHLLLGLHLTLDGRVIELRIASATMRFRSGQGGLPILYFQAGFTGSLPATGAIRFEDTNYDDRIGWKEITVASASGVALQGSTLPAVSPSHELTAYPADLLSSPLDERSTSFSFGPGRAAVAQAGAHVPSGGAVTGAPVAAGGSFAALVRWRLTPLVLVVSLLLAFGFGALHALGPGHGKTVTAAYLVGRGARTRQAISAGLAVSLMHTASVLALGVVALVLFHSFPGERVYPWLGMATGLVALGLGGALLRMRVRARRQGDPHGHAHSHPHGDAHPHGHAHGHAEPEPTGTMLSRRGLAALAVSGGLLPSPTALVVLTGAIAYHRLGYGLGLIGAFSAGLATALIGVALVAMRARRLVADRLGTGVASVLPLVSAAVIVAFGLFFVVRGVAQLG